MYITLITFIYKAYVALINFNSNHKTPDIYFPVFISRFI